MKMQMLQIAIVLLSLFNLAVSHAPHSTNLLLASDALALLGFKSEADLADNLRFSSNTSFSFCKWQGVKCSQSKAVRVVLEGLSLGGTFGSHTLTRLDQLRVLSLQNNSLSGPIPDLSGLLNLKTLFLDHNAFTGFIPPSVSTLHRLRTLDLAHNRLTGPIPLGLTNLDRLNYLGLEWNRLNGSIPPFNISSLRIFNVSGNNLTGAIPVTPPLLRFTKASFAWNPGLCGEIIHIECRPILPFFDPLTLTAPPPAVVLGQNEQLQHGVGLEQPSSKKLKRVAFIVGFSAGVFVLIGTVLCFVMAIKKYKKKTISSQRMASDSTATADAAVLMKMEEDNELEEKIKKVQEGMQMGKSGCLVFCAGESQLYTVEQLMRGSAELLGKGTIGTTYKAVLDNRLIVCVKRLDAAKLAETSKEEYERHMESVGGLRHPNLVALQAYFQAKEERLLVYDYQPNGSVFSLIHGSKSAKSKPLHWTSCLKIAEDVAQGLSYIHQAWRLVHGNLKSSNVLLGPDFEACLTDYCLSVLLPVPSSSDDDQPDPAASYKAPETLKPNHHHQATAKSDVYSFGILLLELLTGKPPPQYPYNVLPNNDLLDWVKSSREDQEDHRLEMLLEVAVACTAKSPERRPTMWQVLKMIQEIKEAVMMEDTHDLELEVS